MPPPLTPQLSGYGGRRLAPRLRRPAAFPSADGPAKKPPARQAERGRPPRRRAPFRL